MLDQECRFVVCVTILRLLAVGFFDLFLKKISSSFFGSGDCEVLILLLGPD